MTGDDVFAKVGSLGLNLGTDNGTQRIYPNYVRMGDKAYPQIVYALENYQADQTLDGSPLTGEIDIKLVAVGSTYTEAAQLAKQLTIALDQSRGTWGNTYVQGCFIGEVSEDHFVDTDMETILYFTSEVALHVFFRLS